MIAVTRLRRAAQRIDPRLGDLAIALLSLAIMISGLAGKVAVDGQRAADIGGYLLALGINLPFAIHRRYPLTAVGVTLVSLLCYAALNYAAYPGLGVFVRLGIRGCASLAAPHLADHLRGLSRRIQRCSRVATVRRCDQNHL